MHGIIKRGVWINCWRLLLGHPPWLLLMKQTTNKLVSVSHPLSFSSAEDFLLLHMVNMFMFIQALMDINMRFS